MADVCTNRFGRIEAGIQSGSLDPGGERMNKAAGGADEKGHRPDTWVGRSAHFVREKATDGMLGGVLIAATGLSPEHWFAHAFEHLHLPDVLAKTKASGLDLRLGLVGLGVAIIAIDVARRMLRTDSKTSEGALVGQPAVTSDKAKAPPPTSVIVLPFTNISDDREQEWFADAVTDDLTTELSRITGSFIIGRGTAFTFKGKQVDPKDVCRELNVRYALTGGVRRLDEDVRLNAQLVDGASGAQIWADRFDGPRRELAALQDRVVSEIARRLNGTLIQADEKWIARRGVISTGAQDETALGWAAYYRPRSAETLEAARSHFEKALAIDSAAIDAMTGLATTLATIVMNGLSGGDPKIDLARAESLVRAAKASEPNNALVAFADGWIAKASGMVDRAVDSFSRALQLNPNHPDSMRQLAECYLFAGEPRRSIDQTERFLRLSPYDPNIGIATFAIGLAQLAMGDPECAIPFLQRASQINPDLGIAFLHQAAAFALCGDKAAAVQALSHAQTIMPLVTSLASVERRRMMNDARWVRILEEKIYPGLLAAGLPKA